jgi:hypothetical protein
MPYTYPAPAPTLTGDTIAISRFLNSPTMVGRRLRTIAEQRYIADALLTQRFQVVGGAVVYETGETIFTNDNPRAVAPGSEYPLTSANTGAASLAKTTKFGQDTIVTDEAIARQRMQPVNKAMLKLVNQNVKFVDSIALSAIASAITASQAAAATWSTSTAQQKITDVATTKASILALNQGYDPNIVVCDDLAWAYAFASFVASGMLPREDNNPAVSGQFPVIDGMTWLVTPNLPTPGTVLVLDSEQLGGMADEDLGGPGYTAAGPVGIQAKTIRDDDNDRWKLRMRRVTVPVILEPAAGRKITGV